MTSESLSPYNPQTAFLKDVFNPNTKIKVHEEVFIRTFPETLQKMMNEGLFP